MDALENILIDTKAYGPYNKLTYHEYNPEYAVSCEPAWPGGKALGW